MAAALLGTSGFRAWGRMTGRPCNEHSALDWGESTAHSFSHIPHPGSGARISELLMDFDVEKFGST